MSDKNAQPPAKRTGAPPGNRNAVRLNPAVKRVIALLLTDPDITVEAACERAQCVRRTFYKAQRSPAYEEHLRSLARTELRTRIVTSAFHRYAGLIKKSESEYVAADLAKDALAQAGVRDRLDSSQRPAGIGSITINIGGRPGEQVRIEAQSGAEAVRLEHRAENTDDISKG